MQDTWKLGGHEFTSRFILGSGKYDLNLIKAAVEDAGAQIITLALRRANTGDTENILDYIPKGVTLLPNTSGARNAEEAVRIARLAREMGCGDFIKIEVIHESKYLLPDNYETIKATEILAKEGFVVMPYMYPDLNVARDLVNAGAAAVMPLAAPIGSNKGLCTKEFIQILVEEIDLPVIVDAGIGRPSQACEVMEMGAAAVMANTAIATAGDIPAMAGAFRKAIEADAECLISASAATDIFYMLCKAFQSAQKAKERIEQLSQIVTFADVQGVDIHTALMCSMPDFEDAVVDAVAERNGASYILTRNIKDFAGSSVPAITPTEFLKK